MIHQSEITGIDKPIVNTKEEGQFTYDELVNIGENPATYEVAAFIRIDNDSDEFYEKLYSKSE